MVLLPMHVLKHMAEKDAMQKRIEELEEELRESKETKKTRKS